jgi:hypothetical protein
VSNTLSWGRKTARFVRLMLRVIVQNRGDFVDVILLYIGQFHWKALWIYSPSNAPLRTFFT